MIMPLTDDDLPGGTGAATVPALSPEPVRRPTATPRLEGTLTDPGQAAKSGDPPVQLRGPRPEQPPLDPEALPRQILDRFEGLRFLGQGGMGTVYRARDRRLDRDVALKLLHRRDPIADARALREARAQARVEHE